MPNAESDQTALETVPFEDIVEGDPVELNGCTMCNSMSTRIDWRIIECEGCHPQNDEDSCAAAIYITARKIFGLAELSYEDCVAKVECNAAVGTANHLFVEAFERLGPGFEVLAQEEGTPEQLEALLDQGYFVVINYRHPEDKVGHYAIVKEVTDSSFLLFDPDPESGVHSEVPFSELDWRSGFNIPTLHNWFVAIRQNNAQAIEAA